MTSQAVWVDRMKQGCQLCHQLGTRITREIDHLDDFDSTLAAWDHRVQTGQRGASMNGGMNRFGRERGLQMFADWTERIAGGELPPVPPASGGRRAQPRADDVGLGRRPPRTSTTRSSPTSAIPRVNANGPVYSVDAGHGTLVITDPSTNSSTELTIPVRVDPETIVSRFPDARSSSRRTITATICCGVSTRASGPTRTTR